MPESPTADHHEAIRDLLDAFDRRAMAAFRRAEAEAKADGSAVTDVDRETTTHLQKTLRERFPDYGLLIEEAPTPERADAPWQWVVDPLDGTAMFARGLPVWGLGMGLVHETQPVEGYLSFPAVGERYGCAGGAVTLNGVRLPPRRRHLPDTRHLLVGSDLFRELRVTRLAGYKLRNFGTNLYHLVAAAIGHAEGMLSPRCYLWDLVPALPLAEAGGLELRFVDGRPFDLAEFWPAERRAEKLPLPLVAAPPEIAEEVIARLKATD